MVHEACQRFRSLGRNKGAQEAVTTGLQADEAASTTRNDGISASKAGHDDIMEQLGARDAQEDRAWWHEQDKVVMRRILRSSFSEEDVGENLKWYLWNDGS